MIAEAAEKASSSGFWQWNSPLPYIYCGLGVLVVAVSCSLLYLFCTYVRDPSLSESIEAGNREKELPEMNESSTPPVPETTIHVVILPGHDNPMFLAKPIAPK